MKNQLKPSLVRCGTNRYR